MISELREDSLVPDLTDFFGCMFAGDIAANKLGKNTIFLVGQSRVGKSTLFNYILGNQLIGKKVDKITVAYESRFSGDGAIGHGFESVTLLPNIVSQYSSGKISNDECLVDMAGFHDKKRNFVGIFTVSYMLKIVFEKIDQGKIILVTDHAALIPEIPEYVAKPFINFIEMLNVDNLCLMDPNLVEEFFDSVAVVVTKAQEDEDFYLYKIEQVIQSFKENESNRDKILCLFLKAILKNQRITVFERAKKDQSPKPCQIIQTLGQKQWKYFTYRDNNGERSKRIYQLPFSKEYKEMKEEYKQSYKQTDENKNRQIKTSCQVLNQMINLATSNWSNKNPQLYSDVFQRVQGLALSNPYRDFDKMLLEMSESIELSGQVQVKSGIEMIKSLQEIAKSIEQIENKYAQTIDSNQKLKQMQQPLKILYQHFKRTFCTSPKQEKNFLIFMFMNIRALHQCAMMNEIDGSLGASAIFTIGDGCQKILPFNIYDMKAKFLAEYIPLVQERDQFSQMINQFIRSNLSHIGKDAGEDISNKLQLKQIQILIDKGEYEMSHQDYLGGVQEFIKAIESLNTFQTTLQDTQYQIDDRTKRYVEFRNRHLMVLIGNCLENIPGVQHLAQRIYKDIKAVSLREKYYKRLLNSKINMEKRYNTMKDYAKFSLEVGLREQAIKIYQQIIDIFVFKPKKIKDEIQPELVKCFTADQNVVKAYKEYLINAKETVFNGDLIESIKTELVCPMPDEAGEQENFEKLFEKEESQG